jgi:hypothetical protein
MQKSGIFAILLRSCFPIVDRSLRARDRFVSHFCPHFALCLLGLSGQNPACTASRARSTATPACCFQASLVFRPDGLFTIAGSAENPPGNRFFPTPWRGFCTPRASSSFSASTKAVPAALAETAYEDQPLTLSALLPRPVFGGEPC